MRVPISFTVLWAGLMTAKAVQCLDQPPAPGPNEAMADYLDQIFGEWASVEDSDSSISALNSSTSTPGIVSLGNFTLNGTNANRFPLSGDPTDRKLLKRSTVGEITTENAIRTLTWDDGLGTAYYNLSIDLSKCTSGIRSSAIAGTYIFTNGTEATSVTFLQIVQDLWSVRHTRNYSNPYPQYTLNNAYALQNDAAAFLDDLVCSNSSDVAGTDGTAHDELRKLLGGTGAEYYSGTLLYMAAAGAIGVGLAAMSDHFFEERIRGGNLFQTGLTGALFGLARGFIMRQVDNGHFAPVNSAADTVTSAAATAREATQAAVIENVFIAWARARIAYMRAQITALRRQNNHATTDAASDEQALAMEEGRAGLSSTENSGTTSSTEMSTIDSGDQQGEPVGPPNDGGASSSQTIPNDFPTNPNDVPNDFCTSPEDAQNSMYMLDDILYQEDQIQAILAGTNLDEFNPPSLQMLAAEAAIGLDAAAHCG